MVYFKSELFLPPQFFLCWLNICLFPLWCTGTISSCILRQTCLLAQGFSFIVNYSKHFLIQKMSYLAFTCKVISISVDSSPWGCSWGHWLVAGHYKSHMGSWTLSAKWLHWNDLEDSQARWVVKLLLSVHVWYFSFHEERNYLS